MEQERYKLWGILSCYLLLAIGYGIANPLFEAPDEHHHYFTAQLIADTGKLPIAGNQHPLARQETAQPPLYYILSALLIAPLDTSNAGNSLWFNPEVRLGDPTTPINQNAFVHTPAETFPWQGFSLAVHLLRLFSTLIGLGTLIAIYQTAKLLQPAGNFALLSIAFVAFLPQFGFLHGAVSNDPLIILFSTLTLWQLVHLWLKPVSTPRLLLLGVTIGLAILSKIGGLLLLGFASGVIFLWIWREQQWRRLGQYLIALWLPAFLLAGWFLWRNWTLYGDPTAANVFIELAGGDRSYTWPQLQGELKRVGLSTIAFFGWMNVPAPAWLYDLWQGIIYGGLAGIFIALIKHLFPAKIQNHKSKIILAGILGVWCLLVFIGWAQFALKTPADQGRLLFPALLPVTLAIAYGWQQIRWSWLHGFIILLTGFSSLFSMAWLIPHTYQLPATITRADIPHTVGWVEQDMGQGVRLVAVEVEPPAVTVGQWALLQLYWERTQITNPAPLLQLKIEGRDRTLAGQLLPSYHGGGLYPTPLWSDGIVVEQVRIQVREDTIAPTWGHIYAGLDQANGLLEIGSIKIMPATWPSPATPPLAQLGEHIQLTQANLSPTAATAGDTITVTLQWHALADLNTDWTVFVHLGDPTQAPLVQTDGLPLNGNYPTRFWTGGEVISDQYTLRLPTTLPAGHYPIQLGMYNPKINERLPVILQKRNTNNTYIYSLGTITVDHP